MRDMLRDKLREYGYVGLVWTRTANKGILGLFRRAHKRVALLCASSDQHTKILRARQLKIESIRIRNVYIAFFVLIFRTRRQEEVPKKRAAQHYCLCSISSESLSLSLSLSLSSLLTASHPACMIIPVPSAQRRLLGGGILLQQHHTREQPSQL